jgi:beta-glucosidase/6-phospho-beta-glucosidase/beta-galactosidase
MATKAHSTSDDARTKDEAGPSRQPEPNAAALRGPRGAAARTPYSYRPHPRPRDGIFTSFFMAGFECSTFIWKDGQRRDYMTITGHDRHLDDDYARIQDLGMDVVREAVRWPLVDRDDSGQYDWSSVEPVANALRKRGMRAIWDLCHYGWPDGIDPLDERCLDRFRKYCRAAAEYLVERSDPPHFFTPVNEISFTSGAATDMGWFYPYAKGRYAEMKRALCRMAIEGAKVIREVDPNARMVHVDPLIYSVPPPERPDLADEARKDAYEDAYEAWDILAGKKQPELGGSPEILDIVGVNVYHFSQAQMNEDKSREVLGPRDPRRKPLAELLLYAWERYQRPIIIGETSGYQDRRGEWLRMVMEESMRALNSGIDLQGVCLYPCVDIPDWQSGEWAKIGIFDLEETENGARIPCDDYIAELRRWQRVLDRPENIEPDAAPHAPGFGASGPDGRAQAGRVQLDEVRQHARDWEAKTPGRQTADGDRAAGDARG